MFIRKQLDGAFKSVRFVVTGVLFDRTTGEVS